MANQKQKQNQQINQQTSSATPQWRSNKERVKNRIANSRASQKTAGDRLKEIYRKEEEQQTAEKAARLGLAYADLNIIPVDPEALRLIPEEKAREAKLVVVFKKGHNIKAAMSDPESQEALAILSKLKNKGFNITTFLASQSSIEKALGRYKDIISERKTDSGQISISAEDMTDFEKGLKRIQELKETAAKIPITEVLNTIIAGALETNASDIHMEPYKNYVRLRYRLDGVLHNISDLPLEFYPYAISRIKMLAGLKLNVTDIPQDGRFSVNVENNPVDLRVSSIPGDFGESFVMRILKQQTVSLQFEDLGIKGKALEILKHKIQKPNGMILTTGPTGSGKTTTLYAFLNKLNSPERKIITLEDPIEYRVEGIEQTQIKNESGYTFASGLRAILRQDPDVILVGEIRDNETANIAVQAALTGHLVFSTLHTNDASGAIPRFLNLEIDPTLLGPAINAIIAQRLVRKLCSHCKESYHPANETIEKIKRILSVISPKAKVSVPDNFSTLYRAKGCPKCNNIGYKGRIGIFEVLEIDPEIEKIAVSEHPATSEIKKTAISNGMITMLQDGIIKTLEGTTTLEEVYRVTGEGDYVSGLLDNF